MARVENAEMRSAFERGLLSNPVALVVVCKSKATQRLEREKVQTMADREMRNTHQAMMVRKWLSLPV